MERDRILYNLQKDEIDTFLDFAAQRGFNHGPLTANFHHFSRQPDGQMPGYIDHDFDYNLHVLNIPAGGRFEQIVEEYRKLQTAASSEKPKVNTE